MKFSRVVPALLAFALYALSTIVHAQSSDALRGAWIADVDDQRHVLYLVLRNDAISGFHCFDCSNPDNLAFIDDGSFLDSSLKYSLYYPPENSNAVTSTVIATLHDSTLNVTITDNNSGTISALEMRRAPAREVPPPIADFRPNQQVPGSRRTLPGTAETITAEKVTGLWLWGTGPSKQYFVFRPHKDGIRGMVCGPCDSAKDFAPLEQISFSGSNFHFEIVHEDNGGGFEEHGPFSNVTDAQVSLNEMHMTTWPSYAPEGNKINMTLLGPVLYMPAGQ